MPKPHSLKTIYNDLSTIEICDLRKWGYLENDSYRSGVISWSRNGFKTASVSIIVRMNQLNPYMELRYNCDGEPIIETISLVEVKSNLGKGSIWYFRCPRSFKRCRKLYLFDGVFQHRSNIDGFYDTQMYSKKDRQLVRLFDMSVKRDEAYSKLYSKHFRTHYKGEPTKAYLDALNAINKGQGIDIGSLLVS